MDYFANDTDSMRVGPFQLQNRLDRVTFTAGTITRDEAGLATLRSLAEHIHQMEQALLRDRDAGQLPKMVAAGGSASNVVGLPKRPREG